MNIAVFCGSQCGDDPLFLQHAKQLGELIAKNDHTMIYGGGGRGLMGEIANSMLLNQGKIIGIIPEHLRGWEAHHTGLADLRVVADMHTRKKMMFELTDVAVILPGGYGTLDELFELLTWNQLSLHDINVMVLNTAGYYNDLLQMMQVMYRHKFLYSKPEERLQFFDVPEKLSDAINALAKT